ncbi:hypothetical protein Taro_006042 [Colocasia esculenta]|uniref:Uncharacterized protein n=1 Tax=Colocasia esculenta TaxID=4460 RepID=A0A843TUW4_COLES|nr:hypothetical protein [Colocasia esculenta]
MNSEPPKESLVHCGVNAYKRSIKIQVQKIKKNTSSGHVSTTRKFPIDRYTHPEQTSYWKLKLSRTYNSFKGSVDTPHTGVDTMLQVLSQKMKKWSSSVDIRSSQVDTRPSSQ